MLRKNQRRQNPRNLFDELEILDGDLAHVEALEIPRPPAQNVQSRGIRGSTPDLW